MGYCPLICQALDGRNSMMTFRICPHCATRVLPMSDGRCPSCMRNVKEVPCEKPLSTVDPELVGIRGWLCLLAIGLVVSSILLVVMLIPALAMLPDALDGEYGVLYALDLAIKTGYCAFVIYGATRFFGKTRNAPSIIIAVLIARLVVSGLLVALGIAAGLANYAVINGGQFLASAIAAAIWIPYIRVSKRVKATFVN